MVNVAAFSDFVGWELLECMADVELDSGTGVGLEVGDAVGELEHDARASPTTNADAAGTRTGLMIIRGFEVMYLKRLPSQHRSPRFDLILMNAQGEAYVH